MCKDDNTISPSVVKGGGEADPGLVPYTTSDTAPCVLAEILAMPTISARQNRLLRLKHHVRTASRLIKETMARNGRKWRSVFVTMTYKPGVDWSPLHVTSFIKNVRMWAKRRGASMGYVWVAEMQRRGAVHYHAVIWIPASLRLPRPDKCGWWRHGTTNLQSVKRNAVGYLMKYVSKGIGSDDPDMPSGARVCGSGGLDAMARDEFHYWRLPRYVRENVQIGERCRRVPGGGWSSSWSGEVFRTEWGLYGISYKKSQPDCNGRPKRDDVIMRLSDKYKVIPGVRQFDQQVLEKYQEIVREENWEINSGIMSLFKAADAVESLILG